MNSTVDMKLEVVVIPVSLRRAEAAHGEHEKRTGQRDADWSDSGTPSTSSGSRPASGCLR